MKSICVRKVLTVGLAVMGSLSLASTATAADSLSLILGVTGAPNAMPEPVTATLAFMGLGALSVATYRRRGNS